MELGLNLSLGLVTWYVKVERMWQSRLIPHNPYSIHRRQFRRNLTEDDLFWQTLPVVLILPLLLKILADSLKGPL